MRHTSCLLWTLTIAGCAKGADTTYELARASTALVTAPFVIGDAARGPTRNTENEPEIVAGDQGFGALWLEDDLGLAFSELAVVDGRLETVSHTIPVPVETLGADYWSGGQLLFDGKQYHIVYTPSGTFDTKLVTLDSAGVPAGPAREAPSFGQQIACSPLQVCIFAGAVYDDTLHTYQLTYSLLRADGTFSPVTTLPTGSQDGYTNLSVSWHGSSFAVVSTKKRADTSTTLVDLWMSRIDAKGEMLGEPNLLTTLERDVSLMDVASDGERLFAVMAGAKLTGVLVDETLGVRTEELLNAASWVASPLRVRSVGREFLVSYNLSHNSQYQTAQLLAVDADGTPYPEGARELSSASVGAMTSPALASDGTHAVALALAKVSYMEGHPPYLESRRGRTSVHGQVVGLNGEGSNEFSRIITAQAAQFAPNVSWNGEAFTASWVDSREGWEHLTLRGAVVTGTSTSTRPLAASARSVGLRSVATAALDGHSLVVWSDRRRDYAYHRDIGVVHAQLVDASGSSAGTPLTLSATQTSVRAADVATNGEGYLATWYEADGERVMAAAVTASGTVDGQGFVVTDGAMPDVAKPALAVIGSAYLVAWVAEHPENSSWRNAGAALVAEGTVTKLVLPAANFTPNTLDAACADAGCMLVADGAEGIHTLRLDASGAAQGTWTRTPGKALDHPRVAFTGSSFVLTALDAWGGDWPGSLPSIQGAYMLEFGLLGTVDADFTALAIDTLGPIEIAADGAGRALLVFPDAETGLIKGLYHEGPEVPSDADAGTGDDPSTRDDAGTSDDAGMVDGPAAGDDAGTDNPPTPSEPENEDRPASHAPSCDVRGDAPHGFASVALLGGALLLWSRRRRLA